MGWWLDWRVAPVFLMLLSFGLIIMAIVGPLKVADQINKTMEEKFLFTNVGQPGWERFVNNTQSDAAPSYLKVWIVNTTNWQEAQMGERPVLDEVGPYVFRQYIVNANPSFSFVMRNYSFVPYAGGLTERVVTIVPWIYLVWDAGNPLNENRTLLDKFTTPNFAVWGLYNSEAVAPSQKQTLLNVIVNGFPGFIGPSAPFQTRNAAELLFGYQDPLLTFLHGFGLAPTNIFQFIRNQTDVADAMSQVNTTTLSCGFPNVKRFQQIILWQNKSNINFWKGGLPPMGTPGNYFGFNERGKSQPVTLFWAQIARQLGLHTVGENELKGVKTFRYIFDESEVLNSTRNSRNDKYYQNGPNGLLNSTSVNTAAVFYSWPHFYLGDPELTNWFDGNFAQPSREKDESWLEVSQVTGITVAGKRLLQGNMPVGGIGNDTWNYSMSETHYWPNYWMSLESEFTDAQANQLKDSLDFYDSAVVAQDVMLIGGGVGATIAFLASILLFYKRREMWKRGSTVGLLAEEQHTEDVPIGYVESGETPVSPGYGSRT